MSIRLPNHLKRAAIKFNLESARCNLSGEFHFGHIGPLYLNIKSSFIIFLNEKKPNVTKMDMVRSQYGLKRSSEILIALYLMECEDYIPFTITVIYQ